MKRTKSEAFKTHNNIIKNGLRLFLEQGYSSTKLEDIAKQGGVTRGAIYWNFKDKLHILNELVEIEHHKLTTLLEKLFNEPISPIVKMEKVIDRIIDNFFNNKSFRDFIELTWFKVEYTQLAILLETKTELAEFFINRYTLVVTEAQKSEIINNSLDPEIIAVTIGFMIDGMYRSYFLQNKNTRCKQNSIKAFKTYINLIKT